MAQLPPKIPNMPPSWPEFSSHQKVPSLTSMQPNAANNNHQDHPQQQNNPSWVDEFLDFSSARRGAHRRSVSDSITFMEPPKGDDDHNEFERFDDAQFLSMFNDEVSGNHILMPPTILCTSNPSSPSDHNSINDDHKEKTKQHEKEKKEQHQKKQLKNELEDEDESQCKQEITEGFNDDNNNDNANATTCSNDRITDPKRVKRILANRQSAQRSRVRKLQYISELERSVTSLQTEVSVLSPRVAFLDHQRLLLNIDNSALKQRIAALAQDKIFKDAHQEALKREIDRLRQVYHQQNMKQMDNTAGSQSQSPKPICDTQTEKEHLINV
ncbi:PREDICTED: basic leucine zipper 61-like [Lupinus angustifolius]|uniref:basic leucine zipper 61-like n=1 Tax=Lupinus angustifolius TaxID=3871 RepID=UPI00092F212D|nr:PREDICTED: basic leucine zipper 61-like [Lupinus angustifolius]